MFDLNNRDNASRERAIPTLLMVGVSLENVVGSGKGPDLHYVQPDQLKSVKLSHPETIRRLRALKDSGVVESCWIWNTCNRFEVYALCRGPWETARTFIEEEFFAHLENPKVNLNVLRNRDALRHLLRTTVGLNSGLPGESDVEQQLRGALRVSHCVGAVSAEGENLIDRVLKAARRSTQRCSWRDFSPSYCQASLESVVAQAGRQVLEEGPIAIVGSSNTSRTCVELLENFFGVDPKRITVYHRCHGRDGQMKQIRRASNGCKRVKVDDYDCPEIARAVASSALTLFGIDRDQPVLDAEKLAEVCDLSQFKGVIVDFNTFGSTEGLKDREGVVLWNASDLEHEVRSYAEQMAASPAFRAAVDEIEGLLMEEAETFHDLFLRPRSATPSGEYRMLAVCPSQQTLAVGTTS
jgi:glutamyl-tRNA reductase